MMKKFIKNLRITAVVLNAVFLAGIIYGITRYGVNLRGLHDKAGFMFALVFPAVTLVALALTFLKRPISLTSVLRNIALILNGLFLILLISAMALKGVNVEHFTQLMVCVLGIGIPALNLVALALTFIKQKEKTPD